MIKVTRFTFEKLDTVNQWAAFAQFGACTAYDSQVYNEPREVDIRLKDGECYQLGMDQSTTNTGIFIKNYNNTVAYMMEYHRNKGDDAAGYIVSLETMLHHIFEGAELSHMIYERPIMSDSYRSSRVLFQLEGMLQGLQYRYPEFKAARLDNIENSSWRRVVIRDRYKGTGIDKKLASCYSIQEIFPWSSIYGVSLGDDQDIFEAMGVLFGWFCNSYDHLGRPYVRGDRFNGPVGGFVLPNVSAKEVAEQFEAAGIKATWAMANPRKSIYENLVCGIERYKVVCVELTDLPSMLALSVECNLKWTEPKNMVVVLVAANYTDRALFEITGKEYHFVV